MKKISYLCVIITFFLSSHLFAQEASNAEQVMNLLSAFQTECSLVDGNAAQAISSVSNLISVIEKAQKSDACQSLASVGSDLMADKLKAQSYWSPGLFEDYKSNAEKAVAQLDVQKRDLLLQLIQTTDSKELSDLQKQIHSIELQINQKRIDVQYDDYNERKNRQFRAVQVLVESMNRNFDQIVANEGCWIQKPSVLQSAAATASSIAYSASIATPIALPAMAIGAGLQLLSKAIQTINKLKFEKKINAFVEVLTPVALTCTLEKFNDIYCESHDRERLLRYVRANTSQISKNSIWLGMRVLNQDLDLTTSWLEKIRSSGAPNDGDAAAVIKEFKIKQAKLDSSEDTFVGIKSEKEKLFSGSSLSQEEMFTEIKDLILSLLGQAECLGNPNSNVENPFCMYYDDPSQMAFNLMGYSDTAYSMYVEKNQNNAGFSKFLYQKYLSPENLNGEIPDLTLASIAVNFKSLFEKAKKKFEREKQSKISEDTEGVFFKAYATGTSDAAKNTAPYYSMKNIQRFLRSTSSSKDPVAAYFKKVDLGLSIILKTIELVNDGTISPEDGKSVLFEEQTLTQLFEEKKLGAVQDPCVIEGMLNPLCSSQLLHLKEGASFFRARVYSVVDYRLKAALLDKALIDDDVKLQLLLANDLVSELQKLQGTNDDDMMTAFSQAKTTALHTSNQFTKFFKSEIQDSLKFYRTKIATYNESEFDNHYRLLTRMCFYLLINDAAQKDIFIDLCKGVFWKPLFEKGTPTPIFSDTLYGYPLAERVCIFRNTSRKNSLKQKQNAVNRSSLEFQQREALERFKSIFSL